MILVLVNDLNAEVSFSLMDNLKIVQYETKSNFETIENIYSPFNTLKFSFAVFLVCCHLFSNRLSGPT